MALGQAAGAATLKHAPPAAAAAAIEHLVEGFDLVIILAILIGLIGGATWRAGEARQKGDAWGEVIDDLTISLLTGLANFIIAALLFSGGSLLVHTGPLGAAGVGMIVGAKGTDAMAWAKARFFNDPKGS